MYVEWNDHFPGCYADNDHKLYSFVQFTHIQHAWWHPNPCCLHVFYKKKGLQEARPSKAEKLRSWEGSLPTSKKVLVKKKEISNFCIKFEEILPIFENSYENCSPLK